MPSGLPALQSGPIGDGLAFSSLSRLDTEAFASWEQASGIDALNGQSGESHAVLRTIGAGLGLGLDDAFRFAAGVRSTFYTYAMPGIGGHAQSTIDGSLVEVSGGPGLWLGNLYFGGRASLLSYGRETDDVVSDAAEVRRTTASVAFPVLRLESGWRTDAFILIGHIKLYNDARTSAGTDSTNSVDIKRRSPAQFGLDWRVAATDKLQIAGMFTGVAAAGANTVADGAPSDNVTDYWAAGLGGAYDAASWLSVSGAYHFTAPAFDDETLASAGRGNLGGSRLDIGFQYREHVLSTNCGASYTVAPAVDYASPDGTGHAERTSWTATAGAAMHW